MIGRLNEIYDILKQDDRLVSKEDVLLKNKVYELAMKMDQKLIKLLYNEELTKEMFFTLVDGIAVFDKVKFGWLIESKDFLPNSYTTFKSNIMLTKEDGKSLRNTDDVILSFPYKDCIVEMDSTKEIEERKEVFLNEVLMKKEIDTLLDAKVFSNVKKYDNEHGEQSIDKFENKDNIIIKGNNLLALHSLIPRYRNRIKVMYWDILYNTKSDKVPYNDSFKHSSWLTMMKNRLEVAKELLKDEGCIFIQLDSTEMAYLKVLCDEIFKRENYIATITCKVKAPSGVASGAQMFFDSSEYILCYAKDKSLLTYNVVKVDTEVVDENSKTANNYNYLLNKVDYSKKELINEIDGVKIYKISKEHVEIQKMKQDEMTKEIYYENRDKVFRLAALSGGTEKKVKAYLDKLNNMEDIFIYEHVPTKGKNKGKKTSSLVYKKQGVLMLKDYIIVDEKNKQVIKQDYITTILNNDWWQGISSEGNVSLKNGKKPEILIKTLLDVAITNKEEDIFLDAYLGSGTSCAVAHKMGIQYVGIEQLDSHYHMALKRLKDVIDNKDKGTVSKLLNWSGGGSTVYCELASNNLSIIDKISNCAENDIINLYDEICSSDFITYNVDRDKMKESKEQFNLLSNKDKKEFLISIIEKNTLYINYSEIEDKTNNILDNIKSFNYSFYEKEGVK